MTWSSALLRRAVAVLGPALATGIGLAISPTAAVAAASLYLLATVAAAAIGGLATGLIAAVGSFVGLNYFFTHPRNTFRVDKLEDVVALFVFLVAAAIVGGLFARIVAERAQVQRREQEGILLNRFTSALLSGRPVLDVLEEFARAILDRSSLARLSVSLDDERPASVNAPGRTKGGDEVELVVGAGLVRFGTLTAVPSAGSTLTDSERRLLGAMAGQLGLAMERARLDALAREARTEAEVSQIRAALFSSVTHDLRTPLASIMAGVTGLLDDDGLHGAEQRRELLRTMLEETERLNRLVGNLLNLARARAGGIALEKELTPFEDVVESVLTRLRPRLAGRTVRTMIRDDLPAIWVDPIQMDQALTNILENAVRHSPPGGEITIAVAPLQEGVQVRVSDRGPGIPPDQRERVFEPFYRGVGDRSRAGTGLGLAITKAVVSAHRGSIRADGTPGGGATIVIELPAGAPDTTPAESRT